MRYPSIFLTGFCALWLMTATAQKAGTGTSGAAPQTSGSDGGATIPQPDVDKSMIPQTPDVAAFGKYGDVAMNLSRGMANVSIPIVNTTTGQLPVDISLAYAYNGYKPQETPGWTGLGWTLNAGGVITRTVRGMVDEDNTSPHVSNGMLDNTPDMSWFQYSQPYLTDAGQHMRDAEPDIYSYSFPGHSGSFILKNGRAVTFPYDNISIVKTGSVFQVVAEDGTYYLFQDIETTWAKLSQGMSTPQSYVTGWHLSQTVSANRADTLIYTYTPVSYIDYSSTNSQQATYSDLTGGNQYACGAANASGNPVTRINGVQLSDIQNRSFRISFTLDQSQRQDMGTNGNYYSLQSIQVFNSAGSAIKQVQFTYDYFRGSTAGNHIAPDSYKLKLKQVTVTSSLAGVTTNSSGQPVYPKMYSYQFAYENENDIFPFAATNGLDIYGYYNGADGNGNLAFSTPTSIMPLTCATSPGNDRTPILAYCKYGSLAKITYPTGGYTTFRYELNPGPGMRIKRYGSTDPLAGTTRVKLYTYTLSDGTTSSVQFLDGAGNYTPFDTYQMQDGNLNYGAAFTRYTANLNVVKGFDYFRIDPQPMYYSMVTEVDSGGAAMLKTSYTFNAFGGALTDVYQTGKTEYKQSGSTYTALHSQTLNFSLPAGLADTSVTGIMAKLDKMQANWGIFPPNNEDNASRTQLFRGEPYTLVSAQRILSSQTETQLSDDGTTTENIPHFYYYESALHRQLTKEVMIDSQGDSIFTQYTYPYDYPAGSCDITAADRQFKTDLQALHTAYTNCANSRRQCTSGVSTCYSSYPCETNAFGGFPAILQTRANNRTAYTNCLQSSINAETDLHLKAMKIMQQQHITNKVTEKIMYQKKAGQSTSPTLLSAVKTEYTVTPRGVPVPKAIWSTETYLNVTLDQFAANKASYYKRRVNMTYDNTPNLTEQHKENDAPDSYIWDVQDKHQLMAQVKNALPGQCAYASFENGQTGNWTIATGSYNNGDGQYSRTSFSGKVSATVSAAGSYTLSLWQKTGQTLTAAVNTTAIAVPAPVLTRRGWNLYLVNTPANTADAISITGNYVDEVRLYPAGSLMTTYSYIPAVGIASVCDANSRYSFYEYDALSRLLQIRDADSNVVKRYDYQYGVPTNSSPLWANTGTASCETNAGGQVTGYQLLQQTDINPQSPTYGNTQTARVFNNTACPSTTCTASACSTAPNKKCVYGACETGTRYNTSTTRVKTVPPGSPPGTAADWWWKCTYHYQWSDGTISQDYDEYNSTACGLGEM